ncbi:hypothetical protein CBR_g49258 [Chara braunii]|uniref:Uncharacterized protein n=1 Tax=Chara braunii TaxID=69332 RepID=A0A388M4F7_CHABU|nr:hypothetical protein CBR_g49258 [Chara braunii]|eukprot:GBG89467.1 hypothetical protein CBR_g49258 [Chara braunii]
MGGGAEVPCGEKGRSEEEEEEEQRRGGGGGILMVGGGGEGLATWRLRENRERRIGVGGGGEEGGQSLDGGVGLRCRVARKGEARRRRRRRRRSKEEEEEEEEDDEDGILMFTASSTRAMEHFLRKGKTCPYRNGEILYLLALRGGKIEGEATKKMLHQYRAQKGIAEDTGMEPAAALVTGKSDEMEELLTPPLAPGREVRVEGQAAGGTSVEDTQDKTVPPTAGPSFQASTFGSKSTRATQTSIRKWAENTAEKRLDTQWGRALFRSGVPFNFVRQDETRALHNLYMELGATKAKVDMPMYERVRTAILDLVYDQVKQEVRPVMDGTFQAAHSSRTALLIEGGHPMGEGPVQGIAKLPWVAKIVKRAKMMVKFIKNHHRTVALFSACSLEETKTLIMPTEVRFASTYQMLERLCDRDWVLKEMMERGWNIHWSTRKLRRKAELIFLTVRSDEWWIEVQRIVSVMRPMNELLRRMDRDSVAPSQLWGFGELLEKRLRTIFGLTEEQRQDVMAIVHDRCKMMRQPAHAANFLLAPNRRDPRWVLDKDGLLVQNAIKYFMTQLGGERWGSEQSHVNVWQSLWAFHCEPPTKEERAKEPMWDDFALQTTVLIVRQHLNGGLHMVGNIRICRRLLLVSLRCGARRHHPSENWSSLDLIHTKRRNNLSSESLAKLVYIHWNMQLQSIPKSMKGGFVDVCACFFDDPEASPANDPAVLPRPLEVDEEEVLRQASLRKTPKGRVAIGTSSDESDSSSEEEIMGRGRNSCHETMRSTVAGSVRRTSTTGHVVFITVLPVLQALTSWTWEVEGASHDDRERAAAKALARRDWAEVQKRIEEDNAKRLAVPRPGSLSGLSMPPPADQVVGPKEKQQQKEQQQQGRQQQQQHKDQQRHKEQHEEHQQQEQKQQEEEQQQQEKQQLEEQQRQQQQEDNQ